MQSILGYISLLPVTKLQTFAEYMHASTTTFVVSILVSILVSFYFLPTFDDNRSKCNKPSFGAEKNSTKKSRWLKFDEFEKQGMSCTLLKNVQFYTKLIVVGQAASATSSYLVRLLLKVPLYFKGKISH